MYLKLPKFWSTLLLLFTLTVGVLAQVEKKVRPKESDVLLEKLFIEANREKVLGNIDEAIHRYLEVLQKDNNNATANYELARMYKKQNQFDKAILRAEKAADLDSDNLLFNALYATLLEKEGNYKKAADLYANLSNQYPDNRQLYFEWAYYLSKSGKFDQAIKVYNTVEKRMGVKEVTSMRKFQLYLQMGKDKKASQEIERLIDAYPNEPEYLIRLANFYVSHKELDKAKAIYTKALDIDPNNATANIAMVEFFLQSGDTTRYINALMTTFENPNQSLVSKLKTLTNLKNQLSNGQLLKHEQTITSLGLKLAELHPSNPNVHLVTGDLLYQQQQYEKALEHYSIAIRSMNNNLPLWVNYLESLHQTDNFEDLHTQSKKMLDVYPSQAKSSYYYGIGLFYKQDYDKAVKELNNALDIAVTDMDLQGDILRYVANCYDAQEKFEASDKSYNESILLHPSNNDAIHDYALSLAKRGKELNKATDLVQKILKNAPDNIKYQTTNGFILFKQGKLALAEQTIKKALENGGNNIPTTLERYGDVLFKLGKEDQAVNYWQMAVDNGATNANLQRKISTKQLYE